MLSRQKWRQGGSHTDKSDEGDKTKDSKSSREEEGIEGEEEQIRKKFKKKSPSERSKVKGKVDLESLENLIKGFREETNQSLKGKQRRGEEVWERVKKFREKWEEWDQVWRKEKEKVWKKLEEIEKKQKATENERKYEVEKLEERMKKLECKNEVTKKGAGGESRGEKLKVVDENVSIEKERLKSRIREIEKKMESEEKMKRSRNIVIRGIKVDSETGREEVEKLLGEIGAEVHVGEIKGVGRKNGGKPSMYIVEMRNEEEKVNVLKRKKTLKGRKERIEEDLTCNERRRKWVMNQRAWGE